MTPPRLDVDACQEKLALMADLVADLDRHAEVTGAVLRADRDRRHVVERILTQLVDIAGGLNSLLARGLGHRAPTGYRDGFELLRQLDLLPQELVDRLDCSPRWACATFSPRVREDRPGPRCRRDVCLASRLRRLRGGDPSRSARARVIWQDGPWRSATTVRGPPAR
jgi:hypothetical protein